jgi:hypothetical protein
LIQKAHKKLRSDFEYQKGNSGNKLKSAEPKRKTAFEWV